MTITPTEEATGAAKPAMSNGQLVALKPPRLHEAVEERFRIDRAGWKALVEAIYPNAETADAHRHGAVLLPRPQSRPIQAAGPHCADVVECGRQDDRDGLARPISGRSKTLLRLPTSTPN